MRRRALLAAIVAGVAGCSRSAEDDTPTAADTSTRSTDRATTRTPQPVESSLPFEPVSADGTACEHVPDDHVCYGRDNHPVRVVPEATTVTHDAPTRFALVNGLDAPLRFNPYNWRLKKRVGTEWVTIAPWRIPAPLAQLGVGDSHVWSLRTTGRTDIDGRTTSDARRIAVDGLGGGTYAFTAAGCVDLLDRTAVFGIDEPALELMTRDGLDVRSDGDTVRGVHPRDEQTETVTVAPVEEAADPRLHCVESLLRQPLLRDAVALLRGRDASRAVVVGPTNVVATSDPVEEYAIRFEGTIYSVRSEIDTGRDDSG